MGSEPPPVFLDTDPYRNDGPPPPEIIDTKLVVEVRTAHHAAAPRTMPPRIEHTHEHTCAPAVAAASQAPGAAGERPPHPPTQPSMARLSSRSLQIPQHDSDTTTVKLDHLAQLCVVQSRNAVQTFPLPMPLGALPKAKRACSLSGTAPSHISFRGPHYPLIHCLTHRPAARPFCLADSGNLDRTDTEATKIITDLPQGSIMAVK
eukprot:SAG22_NODE_7498_length_734_cov_1.264567_1_plen_204_part_01